MRDRMNTGRNSSLSRKTCGYVIAISIILAVEADGSLVVADAGLDAVVRVDPVTGDRTIVSDAATGSGSAFVSPFGLSGAHTLGALLVLRE